MTQTMTEADARRILAEVEPKHAAWEREYSIFAGKGFVDLRPHLKGDPSTVPLADWRPRATRTESGWALSGGWLDEPAPPLPTRGVPNAGGVMHVVASAATPESRCAVAERHAGFALWEPNARSALLFVDLLDVIFASAGSAAPDASRPLNLWSLRREAMRRGPSAEVGVTGRGWCRGLVGFDSPLCGRGTLREWRATLRRCDEGMAASHAAWAAERAELTQLTGAA